MIKEAAVASGRSMNAELILRIQQSFLGKSDVARNLLELQPEIDKVGAALDACNEDKFDLSSVEAIENALQITNRLTELIENLAVETTEETSLYNRITHTQNLLFAKLNPLLHERHGRSGPKN